MALDRTWYDTLIDDDGSNTVGSVWDKADVDSLMDAVDAELPTRRAIWHPVWRHESTTGDILAVLGGNDCFWHRSGDAIYVSIQTYRIQIGLPFTYLVLTLPHQVGWFDASLLRVNTFVGKFRPFTVTDGQISRVDGQAFPAGEYTVEGTAMYYWR